jgi:VWFA-related protein
MRKAIITAVVWLLPASPAVAAAAQAQETVEAGPTIRTTVLEVALDLVVRDARGRAVRDLQPSDVEVYENGVRQQVRSLRLVAGREAEEQARESAAGRPGANVPLRAVNLVCLVFHDMNPATRKYTLEAAQQFVKSPFPADTWVGVFDLASGLTPLVGFTNDRNELIEAARNAFVGRQVDFASSAAAVLNAGGGAINTRAVTGVEVETGGAAAVFRADLAAARRQFIRIEGARGMDQMNQMIQTLGQLPGRKSVLLFSPGLTVTGDPDKFKAIMNAANRADISVYAIDTNGLTQNSAVLASATLLGLGAGLSEGSVVPAMRGMGPDDDDVRTSNTQAPLRALAEGTGGFLVANTNDLRKSFERIVSDVDTHYEVVYHPADDRFDGRFRSVEVRLARAGLNVQSRRGYFALPDASAAPAAPWETAALTALGSDSRPRAFDLHAAAYRFRPEGAASQYALAFEVPAADLTATPVAQAKKQRLHVALLALVKDANGQVVDKISQDFPLEFPDDQMAAVRADAIRYCRPVQLPPGHYSLETAVVDRESNRTTADTMEFDNPAQKGLGMSSIVLVRSVQPMMRKADTADPLEFESKRVSPEIVTDLKPGAQPYFYFVVYPDKANAEKARIAVEVLNNGQSVSKRSAALPAADATGAIPMVVSAPPRTGRCELKITAMQGAESVERKLEYTATPKR